MSLLTVLPKQLLELSLKFANAQDLSRLATTGRSWHTFVFTNKIVWTGKTVVLSRHRAKQYLRGHPFPKILLSNVCFLQTIPTKQFKNSSLIIFGKIMNQSDVEFMLQNEMKLTTFALDPRGDRIWEEYPKIFHALTNLDWGHKFVDFADLQTLFHGIKAAGAHLKHLNLRRSLLTADAIQMLMKMEFEMQDVEFLDLHLNRCEGVISKEFLRKFNIPLLAACTADCEVESNSGCPFRTDARQTNDPCENCGQQELDFRFANNVCAECHDEFQCWECEEVTEDTERCEECGNNTCQNCGETFACECFICQYCVEMIQKTSYLESCRRCERKGECPICSINCEGHAAKKRKK